MATSPDKNGAFQLDNTLLGDPTPTPPKHPSQERRLDLPEDFLPGGTNYRPVSDASQNKGHMKETQP
jgi:hypothetical protein